MRVYEVNRIIVIHHHDVIYIALQYNTRILSNQLGKELNFEIELGVIKDNNEFISVARALNQFDIGIVPYEYRFNKRKFIDTIRTGFTDITKKYHLHKH